MDMESSLPSDASSSTISSNPQAQAPIRTPSSPQGHHFGADFTALYNSIFPPKPPNSNSISALPSPCSSTSSSSDDHHNASRICNDSASSADHRLQEASLWLEYQQLYERYDQCRAHIHELVEEIDSIRRENAALRLANKELVKLLSLSSQAAMHNCLRRLGFVEAAGSTGFDFNGDELSGYTPTSVMDQGRFEGRNMERHRLPKSISVGSRRYLKVNQPASGNNNNNNNGPSRSANQLRGSSGLETERVQERAHMPAPKKEEALEVYNQGMFKTELCNKWEQTGTCPYGNNCQFAHGIAELRPVIRHPRYKTEVCRMVLAGGSCPYGHRCHFRHSLTAQETVLARR